MKQDKDVYCYHSYSIQSWKVLLVQLGKKKGHLGQKGDMIFYVKISRALQKIKSLQLINEFNKVVGYKINIQKQLYFYILAMNIWTLKLKILFIITQKIKYKRCKSSKTYAKTTEYW